MQYENLLKIFNPKFGNNEHIRIYNLTKDIAKKEKSLQRTIERGKDGRNMLKKIADLKIKAVGLLENAHQLLLKG